MPGEARVVLVSCPPDAADALATALIESGAAACVSRVPAVQSVYRWQGAIERASESLLVIKTTQDRVEDLRRAVVERHPYEVPEFLALPVDSGPPPYVEWLLASTRPLK